MEWISVEDRLPEIGERVLAFDNEYGVQIMWLNQREKWEMPVRFADSATHWMPLPEPPKK